MSAEVSDETRAEFTRLLNGYDPWRDAEGYHFDPDRADYAVEWIEDHCTHVKGGLGGTPFLLENWQRALIMTLFGWYDKDGLRRYRELLLYIPRKQGKSPLCAAILLYVLDTDDEPGYEAVSAAATRDQASMVYDWVKGMIRNDEWLSGRFKEYRSPKKMIPIRDQVSYYMPVSADAETKHGGNLHLIAFDELHTQPNRELFDVLSTGTAARKQPLLISLTTAAVFGESICNEKLAYAKAVLQGSITDPTFLPILFYAPQDADWTDLEVWKKANPNFGVSLQEDYVRKEIAKAKVTPSLVPNLKRFHLNIQTMSADMWLDLDKWNACDKEPEYSGPCFAGLDLASTRDICAFVCFWPETGAVACKFYLPESAVHLPSRKHYLPWVEAGYLTVTEGTVLDYTKVREDIAAANDAYEIDMLGFDKAAANEITTALYNEHGIPCVSVPQTMLGISEAARKLERLVIEGGLAHGNNPVLTWMAGNTYVKTDDAENILPSKKHSPAKIDGIAALCDAIAASIGTEIEANVYEERGLICL